MRGAGEGADMVETAIDLALPLGNGDRARRKIPQNNPMQSEAMPLRVSSPAHAGDPVTPVPGQGTAAVPRTLRCGVLDPLAPKVARPVKACPRLDRGPGDDNARGARRRPSAEAKQKILQNNPMQSSPGARQEILQ